MQHIAEAWRPSTTPRERTWALVALLFAASGCAALIYEVVWFQLLELAIGSSALSVSVLLATFMGGMCLGSLLAPRIVGSRHPLIVYAWIEIGIAGTALLLLAGMPAISGLYVSWAASGTASLFVRAAVAGVCLLPPTILMGATLPVVARWMATSPAGIARVALLYGANTAGAVIGSLLAGYYLLRVFDMAVATYVAAALNAGVAVVAVLMARRTGAAVLRDVAVGRSSTGDRSIVWMVIGCSGFTALAAEVIWTRLLSLLLGATTYTFSLVVAVFLAGIGIGSTIGSWMTRRLARPLVALGWCQLLLCAAMAWSAYMLSKSLPYWPINPSLSPNASFQFQLDLVRTAIAVLPGALLWGASFSFALASVAGSDDDSTHLVAGVYAANTVGAIAGSLGASLMIVWAGSRHAEQILIAIAAVAGLFIMARERQSALALAGASAAATLLVLTTPAIPGLLVAFGRFSATEIGQADILYVGEGWNAAVAVSERASGVRNYHNAGKVQASSEPQDMRLQRMLGHLTTLVPEQPRSVLVIGCGAGVTAGAVSIDPAVAQETIAEIEPLVPRVVSTYFSAHNFDVVRNPKVHVRIDDARHVLATNADRFDAITSDPLDPWVKGAAMLYTKEFFELVKRRLNPGGVATLFVQLYESNVEAVKSEMATFFDVFPHGMVFANLYNGQGYDLVLLGQADPAKIDLDRIDDRLRRPEYAPISRSLAEIGMHSATDLFATFAGTAKDLAPWLHDAQITRDRNLRLQYLAGRGLNLYRASAIFSEMKPYVGDPRAVFAGSPDQMSRLQYANRPISGQP